MKTDRVVMEQQHVPAQGRRIPVLAKELILMINYVVFIGLLQACDSRHSGATEESVLANFTEFYLHAAEQKSLMQFSHDRLQKLLQLNSDVYRTIAYTWNTQSIKECSKNQLATEQEVVISDYDRFVQKEKSNFHVQVIDDSIKPCIKEFYIDSWNQINKMIDFNMQVKR